MGLPTDNPSNDALNTFCTPNAPWRLTTIEHGQPGEGWPFNQFYKHVVLTGGHKCTHGLVIRA